MRARRALSSLACGLRAQALSRARVRERGSGPRPFFGALKDPSALSLPILLPRSPPPLTEKSAEKVLVQKSSVTVSRVLVYSCTRTYLKNGKNSTLAYVVAFPCQRSSLPDSKVALSGFFEKRGPFRCRLAHHALKLCVFFLFNLDPLFLFSKTSENIIHRAII